MGETEQVPPLVRINQIQNNDTKANGHNPQKIAENVKKKPIEYDF